MRIKKQLIDTISSDEEIIEQFEEYYISKKKSLSALSDRYAKGILAE